MSDSANNIEALLT